MGPLHVVDHPLLHSHLAVLRDAGTSRENFRYAMGEAAAILAYEAMRDVETEEFEVQTPLELAPAKRPARETVVVAVLRAGLGLVDGFLRAVPEAAVGHVGLQRDEQTHEPVSYYERLPAALPEATVFVVDPMLATGGSAVAAIERVRANGATDVRLVCLVAAPEGIEAVREVEPEIPIVVATLDRELDENAYIRPGLGDAGDRMFGTE